MCRAGATGYGVRLLVSWLRAMAHIGVHRRNRAEAGMGAFLERNRRTIYVVLLVLTLAAVYGLYARAPRQEPIQIVQATPLHRPLT